MAKTRSGQVWLAKLSYCRNNPEFTAVIKISGQDRSGVRFRNLESEEPWTVLDSRDMNVFELLSKVKD